MAKQRNDRDPKQPNPADPRPKKSQPTPSDEEIDLTADIVQGDDASPVVHLREPGASVEEHLTMSDSDINLAESLSALGEDKPQEPASGASSTAWAELIDDARKQPTDEPVSRAKFDSPSDKDLLQAASKAKTPQPPPPEEVKLPPPEEVKLPPSDSEIVVFDDSATGSSAVVEVSDSGNIVTDPASNSGTSAVRWDALVEGSSASGVSSGQVRVDSPSDKDLLSAAEDKPPARQDLPPVARPSDSQVEIGGSGPQSGHSMIRWDAFVEGTPKAESGPMSEVRIDSPSDAELRRRAADVVRADEETAKPPLPLDERGLPRSKHTSDIDLTEEVFEANSSDVNLDSDQGKDDPGISLVGKPSRPGGELPDPTLEDLVEAEADWEEKTDPSNPDIIPDPEGSSVNLGAAPTSGERASSRDLIAEAVESGVDLDKLTVEMDAEPSVLDDSISETEPSDPSSAVDLGAPFGADTASSGNAAGVSSGAVAAQLLEADSSGAMEPPRHFTDVDVKEPSEAVALDEEPELIDAASSGRLQAATADEDAEGEDKGQLATITSGKTEKAPKPAYGKRWLGGGLIGALAGAGACIGLWSAGIEPPAALRLGNPDNSKGQPPSAQVQPANLQTFLGHLKAGDLDKAMSGLQQAGDEPDRLAARGEARWLQYLREQKLGNKPLKADDDAVKQAIEDLKKADNADALYWLGDIQERTGNGEAARKAYQEALKRFKDDPALMRRFQAALDRLDTRAQDKGGAPAARRFDNAQLAVLLLTALQAPGAPAEADEAGYEFWAAVKLAQQGDFAKAIETLDRARSLHDKQRFTRLRKPQNPVSDPTEEIFLRTCDELKSFWLIRASLKEKGYLDDKQRDVAAAMKSVPAASEIADFKKDAGKLKEEKDLAEKKVVDLEAKAKDTLKEIETLKKSVDDGNKATVELKDMLKVTDDKLKTAEGKLSAVSTRLKAAGIKQDDAAKAVDELATARKDADGALDNVVSKLKEGKYLAADAKRTELAKGLDMALDIAQTKDPAGRLAQSMTQVKQYQEQLGQRRSPQELLDLWMNLLAAPGNQALAGKAVVDVERVNRDTGSDPEAKAKAQYVQGLALRNEGKMAEARAALEQVLKGGEKPAEGDWRLQARKLLDEMTDPNAVYLPRAEDLYQRGKDGEALAALNEALTLFPKDNGRLLALRSLVRLELAKAKGKLAAADPKVVAVGQDAQDAIKAGALAEGSYAEGRLAEELGNLDSARKNYQQALTAGGDSPSANRYRIALARVLVKLNQERTGQPGGNRTGQLPVHPERDLREMLVTLLVLAAQAGLPPAPNLEEAQKLADEVLASKDDPTSFLYKSQALALKGLWTRALTQYVEGLRPNLKRDQADTLLELVRNHPALRRPDSLTVANPLAAEQHFAAGLRSYNARAYAEAEKEFLAAVENDNQDARFFYFLGLARLPLNKRDEAFEDFEQGSKLEQQSRPSRPAVSAALERVQGPARLTVNRFRP